MRRSKIYFLLFLIIQVQGLMAVEFSAKEKSVIYTKGIDVLRNYQSIINSIGESAVTNVDKAKSSSESFLELFVNRQVLLFNDLDPSHKLSEFYEAETYASNIILWYPDGIVINMDLANAKVGDILTHDENVYSLDIMVTKSINGNYLNETLNKNKEELTFRIAFGLANKEFTNFRIVGIRNASSNIVVDYTQALQEVNSENLSVDELDKIYTEIKIILQDYTNFLSLLGDPQEAADDKEFYKTSFGKLFQSNETKLYNDITPEPLTKLITVQEYLNNFMSDFPEGIKNLKINTDSARFGQVMKSEDDSYYTFVDANKFFSGNYKGKNIFREMFPLIFRISFNVSGKTYINFKITSVDISSVNFYEDTPEGMLEKKPSFVISPVTRKGWMLSVTGSFGQTSIINKNVESLTLALNDHEWSVSPDYAYFGAVGLSYFFTDNISFRTGLGLNMNTTSFSLNGIYTDSTNLYSDINNDRFNKTINAAFDSLVTMNYITIPVLVSYTSGKPGSLGFYAEAGPKILISAGTTYSNKGNYNYIGYFEADPYAPRYRSSPDWGFYSRENISQTGKTKTSLLNLSFYASAGINIPLGYYTSIMLGPEINIGISDLMNNKKSYSDIFGNSFDHQSTKINYFGVRISLAYKL
jgi:hypothetical protein